MTSVPPSEPDRFLLYVGYEVYKKIDGRGRQQGTSDVDSSGICKSMSDIMKSFIEEARKREDESARERRRMGEEREAERRRLGEEREVERRCWEEEKNNWEMKMEEERQKQDEELQRRERNNEKQMVLLQLMMQGVQNE